MANMGKSPEEFLLYSYRSPWDVARPSTGVLYYRRTMGNSHFVVHALNVRLRKEEKDNVTRQIQREKDYKDSSFQALCWYAIQKNSIMRTSFSQQHWN